MTAHRASKKAKRGYGKHGLTVLKRAVNTLGSRAIDRRTLLGRALSQWRDSLAQDLGGSESLSTQQQAILDLAVKSKLLLDSIDHWLLQQPSLVNARKRALLPVVRERQQLADALARYMTTLGLERKPKPVPTLSEYIAEKYGDADTAGEETELVAHEADGQISGGQEPQPATERREGLSERRRFGRVSEWDEDRGWGFICADNERIFLHIYDLADQGSPRVGDFVEFEVAETARGPRAQRVLWAGNSKKFQERRKN